MDCPRCGFGAPEEHRYCGSCGAELPSTARERAPKITRLFLGIQTSEGDPPGAVLRVSRYLEEHEFSAPEGRSPSREITPDLDLGVDRPVAAISLTGSDAEELGRFLGIRTPPHGPGARRGRSLRVS